MVHNSTDICDIMYVIIVIIGKFGFSKCRRTLCDSVILVGLLFSVVGSCGK